MFDFNYFNDVKFITDEPAGADEFQSGAHARVAETLVSIITSSDGGRAIGLEGTWGSGKSTIVDLARTKFEDWNKRHTPKHAIFVFDAWAHQGDPLRRVFLDKLIGELKGKVVDKGKWEERLERIRSLRKRVTETKAESLNWVGRASLLALPLLPIAYIFIAGWAKSPSATITLPVVGAISWHWLALLGGMIIATPYLAALLTWVVRLNDAEASKRSILVAFNRQTDQVTTEQLIREDEATTIEFNSVFDDLLDDAAKHGYKLIIVLDNLDRLANDQIREIWATMRNFFAASPGTSRKTTLKNAWLIVPIDRKHIEAVFAEGPEADLERNTRGFVEKTFEILLRVPPPLLSNWRQFFSEKLTTAFTGKISDPAAYRIFRFFELHHTIQPHPITPRSIKSFINKIIGQAKLSGNTVPLEYQALYVLYKDEIAANISKLQDSTVLDGPIRATVTDPEWTKYVAAAHFNVSPDQALEILLSGQIEQALMSNNVYRLQELGRTGGFISILHDVMSRNGRQWAKESPGTFFDAVATVSQLQIDDAGAAEHIWHDITECAFDIDLAFAPTDLSKVGIATLVNHARPERKSAIALTLRRALTLQRDITEGFEEAGKIWFSMLEALVESSKDIEHDQFNELTSYISVHPNIEFLFGVAIGAAKSQVLRLDNFGFRFSPDAVSTALQERITIESPAEELIDITSALLYVPRLANWETTVSAIENRLRQNTPPLKSGGAKILLKMLSDIAISQESGREAFKELDADGSLHGIIQLGMGDKNDELMAIAIDKLIDYRRDNWTGPSDHPQYGQLAQVNQFLKKLQVNPDGEPALVKALSQKTLELGGFSQVLGYATKKAKENEVFRAMLHNMATEAEPGDIQLTNIAEDYTQILGVLGEDLTDKFFELVYQFDFENEFSDEEWENIQPEFMERVRAGNSEKWIGLKAIIQSGFEKLNNEKWSETLKKGSPPLALLLAMIEQHEMAPLTNSYYDALRESAIEIIDGGNAPTRFSDRWGILPEALPDSHKSFFYETVRDHLLVPERKVDAVIRFLNLFGPSFLMNADLTGQEAGVVIGRLIDPLLASGGEEGLRCIEANAANLGPVLATAGESNVDFVVQRLFELSDKADEAGKERYQKLAESLGLRSQFAEKAASSRGKNDEQPED